jgi:arabinogalactan endo-1,4-beta-galactosidase
LVSLTPKTTQDVPGRQQDNNLFFILPILYILFHFLPKTTGTTMHTPNRRLLLLSIALVLLAAMVALLVVMRQPAGPSFPTALVNPGFDADAPGAALTGWNVTGPAEAFVLETGGYSGTVRLTQRGTDALVETWQTLKIARPGWYTLRAWVRSSTDQQEASIALKDCGGEPRKASVPVATDRDWLQIVVSAEITATQCTIQLASQAGPQGWVSFDAVEFIPGRAALTIMGADVSSLKKSEDLGGVYTDENGQPGDALKILHDHGLNYIRLRVWVAPADGYHDQAEVLAMAKRAKDLGINVLVDFHYSDTWADPGKQYKPAAWEALDFEALKKAVYDHTFEVCSSLAAQGTPPAMIQIGNEINNGLLWPDGKSDQWDNLAALLKEGYRAVKDCSPETRVMLHLAEGGKNELFRWWFDSAIERDVPFDLIGVSYYPYWHGTLADLQNNLNDIAERYQKDVVVVETAFPFTPQGKDGQNNILSTQSIRGYPFSAAGQEKLIGDVMAIVCAVPNGRGLGIFYWDATWTAVKGNGWDPADPKSGNSWENQALFGYKNQALPAMNGFKTP